MQMRPEVQVPSMIKAPAHTVIPALPSSNKLAVEQASLVVGMLSLMAAQLPVQFRFDRDELARLVETAAELARIETSDTGARAAVEALESRRFDAEELVQQSQRDPTELQQAVRDLRARMCEVVDAFAAGDDADGRRKAESVVLSMSQAQLLRDRARMKPQGWEPDPAAVPDISALLDS
ncbi:hypothetical protein [Aromatoleum toluclasticum]|uniref:hypothetical protein n=1 Tax=Aromatoleum toluclasticum TaxID=92003 RepID=UPI00037195AE|nr:hypothetical protein [Aromatoleum toluclasticum]